MKISIVREEELADFLAEREAKAAESEEVAEAVAEASPQDEDVAVAVIDNVVSEEVEAGEVETEIIPHSALEEVIAEAEEAAEEAETRRVEIDPETGLPVEMTEEGSEEGEEPEAEE